MGELTDREWLLQVAALLEVEGAEGGITLSEEFAQMIAARLRAIACGSAGEWVRTKPEVAYDVGPGPRREETDDQQMDP